MFSVAAEEAGRGKETSSWSIPDEASARAGNYCRPRAPTE